MKQKLYILLLLIGVGGVCLWPKPTQAARHVQRSGKTIALRRKEFDILEYLITNRGRAVTRAMIMDHAWESGKDSWNNTVDVHIKHLRDKVDRPFGSSLIKTAYGIGYMVDDAAL